MSIVSVNTSSLSTQKRATLHLTALMSFAEIIGRLFAFPVGIINAKILGPSLLGVLAILKLVISYAGYTHGGLLQSVPRNVPIAYGRGDIKEAQDIINIVWSGLCLAVIISLVGLWCLFINGVTFKGALTRHRLIIISLLVILNYSISFLRVQVKAEGLFHLIGRVKLIHSIIFPFIFIPAVIFYQLEGILYGLLVFNLVGFIYYITKVPRIHLRWYLPVRKALNLLKTGFLVFINKISESIFWSIDLIFIAALLTTKEVGLYSIALGAVSMGQPFFDAVNMAVNRKIMWDGGKYGIDDPSAFKKYMETYFVCYLMCNAVVIGFCVLLYTFIINTLLPRYSLSIAAMIILAGGYVLYTSRYFITSYLNVTNQNVQRLCIVSFGLAINAVLDYVLLVNGYGIYGVAAACAVSFIVITIALITVSFKQIYGSTQYALAFILKIIIIALALITVLYFFTQWNFFIYGPGMSMLSSVWWGLLDCFLKGIIFAVLCFVLFWTFFKAFKIHRELLPLSTYIWESCVKRMRAED